MGLALLHVELQTGGSWRQLRSLGPGDPPGSVSDNPAGGERQVLLFWCAADGASGVIARSVVGVDGVAAANALVRAVATAGLERIATLHRSEAPYLLTIRPDRQPEPRTLRFWLE